MTGKKSLLPSNVPWTPLAGAAFVVLFILLLLYGAGLGKALGPSWGFGASMLLSHGMLLVLILLFLYALTGSISGLKRICTPAPFSLLKLLKTAWLPALASATCIFGWIILHNLLRQWIGYDHTEQPTITALRELFLLSEGFGIYLVIVMMVVIGPAAEELLFRLILYLPVRESVGPARAAIMISLFFAIMHITPADDGIVFVMNSIFLTGYLFIVAIFFTVIFERTQNILAPIAGHIIYNGAVVLLVILHA